MKSLITVLILLAAFSSCRQAKPKSNNNHDFTIGEWELCTIIYVQKNGYSSENFNVCPTIVFAKNRTGYIKRSDPKLLYFNWQFDNNKLVIRHTINKDKDDIIDDGTYKLTFTAKKLYKEITLIDTSRNTKYILRK
jgi:hypothetical protein